ncbi:hypothetical protein GGR57DRAFT_215317 [Xylariaceae sp. FL1272]|nr:hypothetical protein GGR57DRAFT_215317 [Xylariaceae sp. FL1272]
MDRSVFCSSIRQRQEWAALPRLLLSSQTTLGLWKETRLETHDVAIPLSAPGVSTRRTFRAIFMSPTDVGSSPNAARIDRLCHLNGGRDIAIIFLLKQDGQQEDSMAMFMTLQLSLIGEYNIPIVPIESIDAMLETLSILHRQLVSPTASNTRHNPATSLLPYCSAAATPLTEHAVNILSEVTSDFQDLLCKISTTATSKFTEGLLLDRDLESLKEFWTEEYVVD